MKLDSLNDLFIQQLQDLYSAEKQLTEALPMMAEKASNDELKNAFRTHHQETEKHVERLDQVFQSLGVSPERVTCKGMEGLITESKELMKNGADASVLDAGLIANAQRAEHYEIAVYGTVCTYAKELGHEQALGLLKQTLDEEKLTDEKLTSIAVNQVNLKAK